MDEVKKYKVVGVMSGTSLDGLDLALCSFTNIQSRWCFTIDRCSTIAYNNDLKQSLATAQNLSAYDFVKLHREYGVYIGQEIVEFIEGEENIDLIASHGHTVFHEPKNNVTFQIGCGVQISAQTGLKVVSDFRTLDIALGGQGAPLVPIGDQLLFNDYDGCINLGGFANISYQVGESRVAYDICPVNIITNDIVKGAFDLPYDDKGKMGKRGTVIKPLLSELNNLEFYSLKAPKSLAREWVEDCVQPILSKYETNLAEDILATLYMHYAVQIVNVIDDNKLKNVLFTGGGTFNNYLMELISGLTAANVNIPSKETIDFKEALIFAFLGVLQQEGEVNCLKSVTGARKDNCGGSVTN